MSAFNASRPTGRSGFSRRAASTLAVIPILLAVACGGGGDTESGPTPAAGNPGVVLVTVEGLGAQTPDGVETPAVPALDTLAAQGVRFSWCFAQSPLAEAAYGSLMTGLYPTTNGLTHSGEQLAEAAPTLAEQLQSAGFATAHFSDGGPGASQFGLSRGFQMVSGEGASAAVAWLREQGDREFFLDLHLEGEGATERLDPVLGALRSALEETGRIVDVLFVVASVHGVSETEDAGPLALSLVHVPLVLELPGRSEAKVVEQFVELMDLMPTVLDVVGVPVPEGTQGASLIPLVNDRGQPPYVAFGECSDPEELRFVALGGHRMVTTPDGSELELFDLGADPHEQTDISSEDSAQAAVRRMSSDLQAWSKMVAAASLDPSKRSEELDEATLEQLKSLGYIQ